MNNNYSYVVYGGLIVLSFIVIYFHSFLVAVVVFTEMGICHTSGKETC